MAETDLRDPQRETRRLATFCSSLEGGELPESVQEAVGTALLDTLGAAIGGLDTPESERIRAYVRSASPTGEVPIIGTEETATPEFAALANGTTIHALEIDDGHRGASAHPGAPVIPAALAVLPDANGVNGEDLVAAIAGGYEAMLKIGMTVQPSHREQHFHATATLGCFGAAAAASRLLGHDAETTAHALGLAGTQAGGVFEFLAEGSMAKRFHPGRAAMAGVIAARLAAEDFDGPPTILEGDEGFAAAFAETYDPAPLERLGDPFEVTRSYRKPYPCCRHLHAAIDASLEIRDAGVAPDDIDSVAVGTYAIAARHDKTDVETILDAQMSMPHAVATALTFGVEKRSAFAEPIETGPIASLRDRVCVTADDEMEAKYPDTRATRVVVEADDGARYEEMVEFPLGATERPLSSERIASKLHDLAEGKLPEERRDRLIDLATDLATLDDPRRLFDTLCP
jgi:2-methylcitrate dehydratase PrpD